MRSVLSSWLPLPTPRNCGWAFALMFWSWAAAAGLTAFSFVRCFLWPW